MVCEERDEYEWVAMDWGGTEPTWVLIGPPDELPELEELIGDVDDDIPPVPEMPIVIQPQLRWYEKVLRWMAGG